jgi:predicted MFS family arabinose efflux permease
MLATPSPNAVPVAAPASPRVEFQTVAVLALGFGLVGIDRFLISTLFPVIARDLHLSYSDIGVITGALAVAWGLASLVFGVVSDRIGRRIVLTLSMIVFSVLIGASGLATGLLTLVAARVIMGLADGAFTPASIIGTLAVSAPSRIGRNIGIQQMMVPLLGLGVAPLFVAFALRFIDWRYIFLLFPLPGLALAFALWKIIPPNAPSAPGPAATPGRGMADFAVVFRIRNVRIAALLMLCWLTCLVTTLAFMPNYLLDHLHLSPVQMGGIMSVIGLGATAGTLVLPWLSDKLGRKLVMAGASLAVLFSLLLLAHASANVPTLFSFLFLVHFFNFALIALTVGPLCATSVPAALMATASGIVIAVGELIGGGLFPVVVGHVAQRFGIEHLFWPPVFMIGAGFVLTLGIRSTTPTVFLPRNERKP